MPEQQAPASDAATNKEKAAEQAGRFVLLFVFGALATSLGAFLLVDKIVPTGDLFIVAPIQVVLGSVVFLVGISGVVVVFARLSLQDKTKPLALPEGSVRAIIALVLLVIFVIFANIIYGGLQSGENVAIERFNGLTIEQIERLSGPVVERTEILPAEDPRIFEGTYERPLGVDADAKALGQQIVTALITLVTAISAFYFGSGNAALADRARRAGDEDTDGSSPGGGAAGTPEVETEEGG